LSFTTRPGRFFGKLRHKDSGKCLQKPGRQSQLGGQQSNQPSGPAILEECVTGFYGPQQVVIAGGQLEKQSQYKRKETKIPVGFIMSDESVCLDSPTVSEVDDESTVRYQACNQIDRQVWIYDDTTRNFIHAESGKCLTHPHAGTSAILNLKLCQEQSSEQMWELVEEQWKDF